MTGLEISLLKNLKEKKTKVVKNNRGAEMAMSAGPMVAPHLNPALNRFLFSKLLLGFDMALVIILLQLFFNGHGLPLLYISLLSMGVLYP